MSMTKIETPFDQCTVRVDDGAAHHGIGEITITDQIAHVEHAYTVTRDDLGALVMLRDDLTDLIHGLAH